MNFKILTVNGRDLSGASHDVAANAFQNASEPITVVLRRSGSKSGVAEPVTLPDSPRLDTANSDKTTTSTQTQDDSCFCRYLLQNSAKLPYPLASLIKEFLRLHGNNLNTFNQESSSESYPTEEDDDVFGVDYEEVVLRRTSKDEKLGLVLREHLDTVSNQVKVIVSNVSPDSIAARCQKIYDGDHIVKINGFPVSSMNEASKLLHQNSSLITFVVGHPHFMDDEAVWPDEDATHINDCYENDDPLCDVTDCTSLPIDHARRQVYFEHRHREGRMEHTKKLSQKLNCDANGTTESGMSNRSTGSSNQTGKDSGIGHTMDSSVQSGIENSNRLSSERLMFGTGSTDCSSHSLAREFTFVSPQNYRFNKRSQSSQSKNGADDSADSAKGSMERCTPESLNEFQKLNEAVRNLELENKKNQVPPQHYSIDEIKNGPDEIVSPWVKIARQDYEDKIKQLEKTEDVRVLHPALTPGDNLTKVVKASASSSRSPSITTDNTSSAYSTGESFRSSSTASAPRSGHKSPSLSPTRHKKIKSKPRATSVTMTYYMSSDANSDGEGPACYLTHNEESESEGFEDAGLEFSSMITSASSLHSKPVPLPRILHPPHEATNFMSTPLTTSTQQLCHAAVVAKSRRQPSLEPNLQLDAQVESYHSSEISQQQPERCRSPTRQRSGSRSTTTSSKDRSESETIVPTNCRTSGGESTCTNVINETDCMPENKLHSSVHDPETYQLAYREKFVGPKVRRSSESSHLKKKRPEMNRSLSCAEQQTAKEKYENANRNYSESSPGEVQMEWKVRVSKDGTRYITKRPVREKAMRHREKRILAERCGITTDDDVTDLKLGRHWSRDERKRHLRHAREKKRRRDFMQRCRLEVLNENANAEDIVELSHKKMTKQKHKRMLLDNFFTVQEILAHGDRTSGVTNLNPLLSVTYI